MSWSLGSDRAPQHELESGSAPSRFRWWLVVRNGPFLTGALVLIALVAVALFGPQFASENPYLSAQRSAEIINGEVAYPPFAPSAQFPLGSDAWGRDILSLLLWGARNTLVAAAFVTMVRLVLGFALGAFAGWRPGTLLDRLIMGAVEVFSALPLLLTGMILILALDIRRGLITFLVALSLVGWGEIAQYIRGEFIGLRERPFVEGARAAGLRERQVVSRHMLPNVLPQLVVLTLLEFGAVLMLLGELGFVGVFIGGGILAETFDARTVIADIPEWGALLATTRSYLRSAPWMILYPALAFFVAVLGANLLGEGLRRIIRDAGINTAALVSKRMALGVAVISLLTWYVVNQIGPGVSYAKLASQVDTQRIVTHTQAITALQSAEPGFGTAGARAAAEYIADHLEELGALPAATTQAYLQPVERRLVRRLSEPLLRATLHGRQDWLPLTYGADFCETITRHGGSGEAEGALVFVAFGRKEYAYRDWRGLDLEGRVVLVLGDNMPAAFDNEALIRGARGVLIVTDHVAPRLDAVSASDDVLVTPSLPILHVRAEALAPWLAACDRDIATLQGLAADLTASGAEPGWATLDLPLQVLARVELSAPETVTGYNVLGILPGNDLALDEQVLLVGTGYDLPEATPGRSTLAPSDGPAGAAILLEIMRLWHEESFKPRRAVLLCFWAGGHLHTDGAATFEAVRSPYLSLQREAAVRLDSVGGAGVAPGSPLVVSAPADSALAALIGRSAQVLEVPIAAALSEGTPDRAAVRLGWDGAASAHSGADTLESLDSGRLAQVGQLLNLTLITATRQYHY